MNQTTDNQNKLSDPFEKDDIEWRVQSSGIQRNGKPWVKIIPYITSRAVQQRLDDVFGYDGWENYFSATPDGKGYLCGIKIKTNTSTGTHWITKSDGAEYTNIEALKGALSGAFKRAAVHLGIGRYLYSFSDCFAVCSMVTSRFELSDGAVYAKVKNKSSGQELDCQWFPPELEEWALPSVLPNDLLLKITTSISIIELKVAYKNAFNYASSFKRENFLEKVKAASIKRNSQLKEMHENNTRLCEQNIRAWLERQVTGLIMGAENASTLRLAKNQLLDQLSTKCQEDSVSFEGLSEILNKYYLLELSKLNDGRV